jgi:hypothetical protein
LATGFELNKLISDSLEIYNKYRSPEAKAKLLSLDNRGFTIEFEGVFCQSCGVKNYFEDYIHELKKLDKKVDVEIQGYEKIGTQSYKVRYIIKKPSSNDNSKLFNDFLRERGLKFEEYLTSNACTKDIIRFQYEMWLFEKGIK